MKKKRLILIGIIIMIGFMIPIFCYFEPDYVPYDEKTEISITINGEYTDTFPKKESGFHIEDITCDHGASGEWDEENWSFQVKDLTSTHTKCRISFFRKYEEEILHGTDPVLKDGLIPVTIDNDGTVHKASLYQEWYSYANQKWANAVILEDESITYEDYEEIPESNIESYFVWIPRYKYQLFDLGEYSSFTSVEAKEDTINVVFGTDTTDDAREGECTTPMTSGESGNCKVGDYMSHPAFLSFGVNGIWVGKFETGYKGATSKTGAEKNEKNSGKVQIKPNVYSWRNINQKNEYLNSYNYKREYDSHMMKNTEWGAVSYLQHSVYGSHTNVSINNNSNYITGYAAKEGVTTTESTVLGKDGTKTYNYKNPLSVSASTTNNYSGIYDMSGGAFEFVMGVLMSAKGELCASGVSSGEWVSGFAGPNCYSGEYISGQAYPKEEKYYDKYIRGTSSKTYNRRILGDATGEMGPFASGISSWYSNRLYFVYNYYPWFKRGNMYNSGNNAGIFASEISSGGAEAINSFRIVLAF